MSPQNWDDDFDFQDSPPKAKKVQPKQKPKTNDDDFFNENSNKLPVLNYKNTPKQPNQNKKATPIKNPYADNMKLRGNIHDDDNISDQVQSAPKNKKQTEEEVDFQEEIDYDPPKKTQKISSLKTSPKQELNNQPKEGLKVQNQSQELEQNYEQEVFQQDYGEDFEEVEVEEPPKKVSNTKATLLMEQPKKIIQISSQKKIFNPPKPPSRASQVSKNESSKGRNLTVNKNLVRNNSRNSLKSAESRRGVSNSRAISNKFSTNASFVPNKYTSEIDKSFPDINLGDLNQDKVNKLNQKLRVMIKKFNDELNELINKNMLHLKAKKNDNSKAQDNKLRVLQQQCKNNETVIETMTKEFDKLSGRDGELREEQYQLMTQKRIQEIKDQIKQSQKTIVKLKNETKSEGNKLTNKNEDKKLIAELHHLKTTLIQSKKDEQKQALRIEKLDEQMLDLGQKVTDIQYKISELVDLAKDKGIQIYNKEDFYKKFQILRKKVDANKNHKSKLQNLLRTKSDIVVHEKQQLRINIKNCELQIKNLYDSISHSHNQSVKVVQKAKANPKLNKNLLSDLDAILKSLQLVLHENYSVRSEQNKSQHSNRPLKISVIGNMGNSDPHKRSQSASNNNNSNKPAFGNVGEDHSKPNLLKKKMKINELLQEGKNEAERIWKNEEKEKIQKQAKPKQPEKLIVQDKKKPFTLKKNRLGGETKITQEKSQLDAFIPESLKLQIQIKKPEQKKQQISLAGPRMMKFKRRNNQEKQQEEKPVEIKLAIEQKPKLVDEQQPLFAPKRFNLRNRMEKKEQSYVPTIQKEKEIKKEVVEQKKQEQKPKFNFGEIDDPYKKKDPAQVQVQKKQPEKIVIPGLEDDDKPKLNLRLRDRKKNIEQVGGGYTPSGVGEAKQQEKHILGQQKQSQISNPYTSSTNNNSYAPKQISKNQYAPQQKMNNPYAPKENFNTVKENPNAPKQVSRQNLISNGQNNNPYAPKEQNLPNNPNNPYIQNQGESRKKQGPVKKPKVQPLASKQKINIYEQAQEAEGLNQFVNESPKRKAQFSNQPQASSDLNLNDLLGVQKNKKNTDDLADLLGGAKNNKKVKKNNDFFDDLDL